MSSRSSNDSFAPYVGAGPAISLVAAAVALPSDASSVSLLDSLPPDVAAIWEAPSAALLLPHSEIPKNLPRPRVRADPAEYLLLLRRLADVDMVAFRTERPRCVNGAFGVAKSDGGTRLIIDARAANAHFRAPLDPGLPSPSDVAALACPQGESLLAAKSDLANCYHSIRMPEWLMDYFGLPSVRAGDLGLKGVDPEARVWPVCTRLAMGFNHAVYLAQQCNIRLLLDSGVRFADLVLRGNKDFDLSRPRVIVYLDDVVVVGLERHRALIDATQGGYVRTGTGKGWVFSLPKLKTARFVLAFSACTSMAAPPPTRPTPTRSSPSRPRLSTSSRAPSCRCSPSRPWWAS